MFAIIVIFNLIFIDKVFSESLTNTVHKTQAAAERVNDLFCYQCHTMEDGEACIDLIGNRSNHIKKCHSDEYICMVQRFSYTTSTENSTSPPKMWSLERRCTSTCEPGCIVIGERTKLYACVSCCENSLCNTGKGDGTKITVSNLLTFTLLSTFFKLK